MPRFFIVRTFPFSKVKITSESMEADCGLLSLAFSPGLIGLSWAPYGSERDALLFLLLKNSRHLDMMIGDKSDGPYSPRQTAAFDHFYSISEVFLFVDHHLGDVGGVKSLLRSGVIAQGNLR